MDITTEFEFMRSFIVGADFELDNLLLKQLRALWTAFCFHNRLDVDTATYDLYLRKLWETLLENGTGGFASDDFDEFDRRMAKYLV